MADLAPFPDVEDLLIAALAGFGEVDSVYPPDLQDHLPFVRTLRLGGGDDRVTDAPRVEIEVAAETRDEAMTIARAIQQRLISGPVHAPGIGVIDRVETEMGPRRNTSDDQNIRRVFANYRISTRRANTA